MVHRTACFDALIATRRQVAAYSANYFGPLNGAKAAGYLLLNLCHPNIVFAQVIVKLKFPKKVTPPCAAAWPREN